LLEPAKNVRSGHEESAVRRELQVRGAESENGYGTKVLAQPESATGRRFLISHGCRQQPRAATQKNRPARRGVRAGRFDRRQGIGGGSADRGLVNWEASRPLRSLVAATTDKVQKDEAFFKGSLPPPVAR
jgi:hypothetical protein